ncbi:MAG: ferredoxin--NADP(+) reductase [Burkholderiales bacterium PBB3]|nr:MAG: ferredoxin--NADP(+) reductase [Burkholderiales bacterium PBB3]
MTAPTIEADAVVIGAGPVGLFQVFQLGLLEVKAHVIDALPYAGGQCIELYPDKPIYDIPAVPATTGRALTQSLLQQIAPFGAQMHFGQQVQAMARQEDGRWLLTSTAGSHFLTRAVFIAAGVGAFVPRTLQVPGIGLFHGTQLHYHPQDFARYAGKDVVILGDNDAALEMALALRPDQPKAQAYQALSVTVLHRRDVFNAEPATLQAFRACVASGQIALNIGQITGFDTGAGNLLTALLISNAEGHTAAQPLDYLAAFSGLSPKLGPVADWGLVLERKQITVNTEDFGTELPGVFAVGDINTYPGKKKLIVCGFHEATLAAYGAMRFIAPEKKVMLQYTTTSPRLHALLGVHTPTHTEKNAG